MLDPESLATFAAHNKTGRTCLSWNRLNVWWQLSMSFGREVNRCRCDCVKRTGNIHLATSKRCSNSCTFLAKSAHNFVFFRLLLTQQITKFSHFCAPAESIQQKAAADQAFFDFHPSSASAETQVSMVHQHLRDSCWPQHNLNIGGQGVFFFALHLARSSICVRFSKYELDLAT